MNEFILLFANMGSLMTCVLQLINSSYEYDATKDVAYLQESGRESSTSTRLYVPERPSEPENVLKFIQSMRSRR